MNAITRIVAAGALALATLLSTPAQASVVIGGTRVV